jgi:hypothetical protein
MGNTIVNLPGSVDDPSEYRLTSSSCMSSGIEALKEIDGRQYEQYIHTCMCATCSAFLYSAAWVVILGWCA